MRVLLVYDNAEVAASMEALVRSWGYEVRAALSGASGVRIAVEFQPDTVVIDLGLPDLHGYDVATRMRKDAGSRPLHFIALTGMNQIADQLRSTAARVSNHLMKPANPDALRAILENYAKGYRQSPAEGVALAPGASAQQS